VNETASAHEAMARNRPVAAAIENLPFMWSIYDEELGVPNDLDQSGAGRSGEGDRFSQRSGRHGHGRRNGPFRSQEAGVFVISADDH
jgi:hypothetical protein